MDFCLVIRLSVVAFYEFNTFKKNHEGDAFGDIVEGEPTMGQVGNNFLGFLRTIPHKAKEVFEAYVNLYLR